MAFDIESSAQLAARIRSHCESIGKTEKTFSQTHFRNPHLVARLDAGGFVSRKTYLKLNELIGPPRSARRVAS